MSSPQIKVMRKSELKPEAYAWGALHWMTSAAVNGARELTLGHTTIAARGRNPLHRHPNCEEVLYVIAGEIDHVLGAETMRMRSGEAILIPRNAKHQAINAGNSTAELLVAFSSAHRETIIEE